MQRYLLLTAILALTSGTAADTARAQEQLRWKFRAGESLGYQIEQVMDMKSMVNGMNIGMEMSQTMDMQWTTKSVNPDGSAVLGQTITRIVMSMKGAQIGEITYDSDKSETPSNPILASMAKMYDALVGNESTLTMSPQGEVSDVKLPEKLLQTLRDNPQLAAMPGGGAKMFENMANQSGVVLPEKAVQKGGKWTHQNNIEMPFGDMQMNLNMVFKGSESRNGKTMAVIDIKPELTIKPKENSPIKIEIKSSDANGELLFDNTAGRIAQSSMTTKMAMVVNGAFNQNISQTMSMKLMPRSGSTR